MNDTSKDKNDSKLDDYKDYKNQPSLALLFQSIKDSRNIFVLIVSLTILIADILIHKGNAWLIFGVLLYIVFSIINIIFAIKYAKNTNYNNKIIAFVLECIFLLAIPIYVLLSEYAPALKILLLIIIGVVIITTITSYKEIKRSWYE